MLIRNTQHLGVVKVRIPDDPLKISSLKYFWVRQV